MTHILCNNVWVSKYPNLTYGTHLQKWIHFASLGKQLHVHNLNTYTLDLHTKAILGTSQVPVPFKGHCFSKADTHWDSLLSGTKCPALGQESVTDPRVAAAKSLQSCPTLCDPIDGSPTGSPIPGIFQARTLEWVAISFSKGWKWKVKVKSFSRVRLLATPWTAAYQAPPSMGFSRQEYWSGVPLSSPTDPRVGDINSPTLVFTSQCTGRKKETHRRIMHKIFRSGWEKWMNIYLQQIQRKEQRKRGTTERAICVDTEVHSNNELCPFYGYIMGNKWQGQVQGGQDFKETLWLCYENSNELN